MIERVSNEHRHRFSPLLELFTIRLVACDVLLRYAVCSHLTPLIMVSAEPYLENVVELSVLCDFLRIDMAVVVEDRCILGVCVVELDRCRVLQHEILVHELFHWFILHKFLPVARIY